MRTASKLMGEEVTLIRAHGRFLIKRDGLWFVVFNENVYAVNLEKGEAMPEGAYCRWNVGFFSGPRALDVARERGDCIHYCEYSDTIRTTKTNYLLGTFHAGCAMIPEMFVPCPDKASKIDVDTLKLVATEILSGLHGEIPVSRQEFGRAMAMAFAGQC